MATNTSHYNLVKPAYSDTADIAVINGNMDTIDTELYNNNTAIAKYQIATYTGDADSMTNGIYYCDGSVSNLPTTAAYIVHCMVSASNNTYVDQVAYQNQTETNIYIRRKRGSAWTGWKMLSVIGNISTSSPVTNFTVKRSGDVVYMSCVGNSYTVDSNNNLVYSNTTITIPSGYRPTSLCNIWETNVGTRIVVNSDGTVKSLSGTGGNLRFSACWITADDYPT